MPDNKYLFENNNTVCFYPVTHESGVIDNSNTSLYTKLSNIETGNSDTSNYINKLTYEYKSEINSSASSYIIQIGQFSCSNSNIIINISSGTSSTYHGIAILTTQDWSDSNVGTYVFNVYEDDNNMISQYLYLKRYSNSDLCNIYFNSGASNKTLVHIQCININGNPTNICKFVTSIPSDATIHPTNVYNNFINNQISSNILTLSGGIITAGARVKEGSMYAMFDNQRFNQNNLAIGKNGILINGIETDGDWGGIIFQNYGSSYLKNYLEIMIGNDATSQSSSNIDKIVFRRYNSSGQAVSNVYVPSNLLYTTSNLFLTSQILTVQQYQNSYDDPTKLEQKSGSFTAYPNITYLITSVTSNISITFSVNTNVLNEFRFLINYNNNNYSISFPSAVTWQKPCNFAATSLYEINVIYNPHDYKLYGACQKYYT